MRTIVLFVICGLLVAGAAYWFLPASGIGDTSSSETSVRPRILPESDAASAAGRNLDSLDLVADGIDLDDVIDELALMPAGARANAVDQLAAAWVGMGPVSALERASRLPEDLRRRFRVAVSLEWARLDPDAFLDYAEVAEMLDDLEPALRSILESNADRVLMIAHRMTPAPGASVAYVEVMLPYLLIDALDHLLDDSPVNALDLVRSLPEGRLRARLMRVAGAKYALKDAEAAFEWLDEILEREDEPASVMFSVEMDIIAAVSTVDLGRGIQESLARASDGNSLMFLSAAIAHALVQEPDLVRAAANHLVTDQQHGEAYDRERLEPLLNALLSHWVRVDAEIAGVWILSNAAKIGDDIAEAVVNSMATDDPGLAIAFLDRVPTEWRDLWMSETARAFARQDPVAATNWIAQFAGLPVYERLLEAVLPRLAASDPEAAARMFDGASSSVQQATARDVARAWAAAEPAAAAQWLAQLGDLQTHVSAVTAVVAAWVREQPETKRDAALQWVMDLSDPFVRDRALRLIAQEISRVGNVDAIVPLLSSFHSNEVRQEVLQGVISSHPARADELLGYVTDPEFREWVLTRSDPR